jgi:PKD repeat protein
VDVTAGVSSAPVVATFTDADPATSASEYSATVDWGDGSAGAGTVSAGTGGGYEVSGPHAYAVAGSYPVKVTIQDAGGAAATANTTAVAVVPTPAVSRVSMTHSSFRVAKFATPLIARMVPSGTTFRYTLSEPARVRIAIKRSLPGRKSAKRCVKPTRHNVGKSACTRLQREGALTRTGHTGRNSTRFSGRLGHRALAPGRYRASITATAAGKTSSVKSLAFTIVSH